jgi:hypothetical protein
MSRIVIAIEPYTFKVIWPKSMPLLSVTQIQYLFTYVFGYDVIVALYCKQRQMYKLRI